MEYKVETLSPVKIKVDIEVPAEEVNAALATAAAQIREQVQMDGFRKGKVPINIIKKRYGEDISQEALNDLINVHINQILSETGYTPVSGLNIKNDDVKLETGKDHPYEITFEVLPAIELPVYEGLSVEQDKFTPDPNVTENMLKRIRRLGSKLKPVEGIAPAKDFQVANLNFEVIENGKPIPDLKIDDFDLELGAGESIPEFEELVKGIPVGNTGEKEITFPDDFVDPKLAGKTVLVRVKVNAVKEPDITDFEKSLKDHNTTTEDITRFLTESYEKEVTALYKAKAQRTLLNQLLKMVDVPLVQTLVDYEKWRIISELEHNLARQGKRLDSLGKTKEELDKEAEKQAEDFARQQTLLLLIAHKEGLDVSDQELANHLYKSCVENGEDLKSVIQTMRNNGLIERLRERMLADKAMDLIYDKANVTFVDPDEDSSDNSSEKDTTAEHEDSENGDPAKENSSAGLEKSEKDD